jgi:hypothetical protein
MPDTTRPTSRAAYLRAYRARHAAAAVPHVCPHCHTAFPVERSDARYCSDACRAAAWRPVAHRGIKHRSDGWLIPANESGAGDPRLCDFVNKDRTFCCRPATWAATSCRNADHHLVAVTYRCDEHCTRAQRAGVCDRNAACHRGARCPAKDVKVPARARARKGGRR